MRRPVLLTEDAGCNGPWSLSGAVVFPRSGADPPEGGRISACALLLVLPSPRLASRDF